MVFSKLNLMSTVSVERALILLRYLVEHPDGLSIREAARSLGYAPASIQKLVAALTAQGYAVQDESTDRYHLGPEAVQLGLAALTRLDIRRVARPHLERLCQQTGETIFLAIPRRDHVIYVDKIVSEQPIRMDAPLGVTRPYNCTAVGKILLADRSRQDFDRLAASGAFVQQTALSITDPEILWSEIMLVRGRGWADDDGEFDVGAGCVAAPIFDHDGRVAAAITASGPNYRISAALTDIVEQIQNCARQISQEIGAPAFHYGFLE